MKNVANSMGGNSQVSNEISVKARANEDLSWIEYKKSATKLAALDPLKARCFGHENYRYHVGDRGLKTFKQPDIRRVNDLVEGKIKRRSDVDVARYASNRISSQRAILSAVDYKSLDHTLIIYVDQRMSMLEVMHRFYGKKGLNWMREAYESPRDKKIVTRLKKRFLQGDKASRNREIYKGNAKKSREFLLNVALLTDNSKDFIPCYARVILGTSKPVVVVKAKNEPSASSKLPVFNTSLRGTN